MAPNCSIGDHVRVTKKKKTFNKGYTQRWTEEVFRISKIKLTIPVTYKITDYYGEEILGSFYEQELQKTKQESSILMLMNQNQAYSCLCPRNGIFLLLLEIC